MMGFSGPDVDRMTLTQMCAAIDGFKQLHGIKADGGGEVGHDEFMRVLAEETAAGRVLH